MPDTASYSFPPFRLDVENGVLWRETTIVPLRPKTFAVLHHLLAHAGHVVTRDDLRETIWGKTKVSAQVLRASVWELRQALGDGGTTPLFVETVPGRGWRFIATEANSQQAEANRKVKAGQSSPALSPQPPTPLLVGRDSELSRLHGWLDKALSGERQMVFVTGEPGIGKTALVEAFVAQLGVDPTVWISRGQCVEQYGEGEAYMPVLEALGRLSRRAGIEPFIQFLDRYAPTWLVQLPGVLNDAALAATQLKIQGASQHRMLREFVEAVETFTTNNRDEEVPVLVFVLEDLQWSDTSTLELLASLARRREPARLLLIATYRPEAMLGKSHPLSTVTRELYAHHLANELTVGLLSEPHIADYLQQRFPHNTFPANLAQALHQRTEGNPLFLTNLLTDWISRGIFFHETDIWKLQANLPMLMSEVPETIRQLITIQREHLLAEEQRVLEAASLAGVEFSSATVAAALQTGIMETEEWCAGLARRQQFLRPAGVSQWPDGTTAERYRFLHALHQQFWHEHVSLGRRRQYHLRIGERQETAYAGRTAAMASELALHFEEGQDYRRATHYRRQAAENAIQRYAHQEAVTHLTKGLELLNHLSDTPDRMQQELTLRTTLGISLQVIRGYGSPLAEEAYARARKLSHQARHPAQLFGVLYGLWQFHLTRAEHVVARELGEQLLSLARSMHDDALLVEAHGVMGISTFYLGELQEARTEFEELAALYNFHQHHKLAFTYGADPCIACGGFVSQVLWLLGYPKQARKRSEETLQFSRQVAHPFSQGLALHECALFYQFIHDIPLVQQLATGLSALAQQHQFPYWELAAAGLQGWLLTEQGQEARSIAQIRQSSSARRTTGSTSRLPYYQASLAVSYYKLGQLSEALEQIDKAMKKITVTEERWWEAELYRLKGEIMLQYRVEAWSSEFPGKQSPRSAKTKFQAEAEECFLTAITIARKQHAKSLELRAVMSLSRLYQQQGKKKKARDILSVIYGWFTEGFDTPDLQEAKALLAALA